MALTLAAGADSAAPAPWALVPVAELRGQTAPAALVEDRDENLLVVQPAGPVGLALATAAGLQTLVTGAVDSAACSPEGDLYYVSGDRVLRRAPGTETAAEVTADFGGPPGGARRVVCSPDGALWVEGCPRVRSPEGSYLPAPASPQPGCYPVPQAYDKHGNYWSLAPDAPGSDRLVPVVLPGQDRRRWVYEEAPGLPPGPWLHLRSDEAGRLWVSDGRRLLWHLPAQAPRGWEELRAEALPPEGALTALGTGPDGYLLVGTGTGDLLRLAATPEGEPLVQPVARVDPPAPITALHTEGWGRTWLLAGERLYRRDAAPEAWQRHWQVVARLPAGNHDLEGAELQGKWYVAGGATAGFGYPVQPGHIFDEIWEYDPARRLWRVAAKLAAPRVFPGLAVREGRLWVIGGDTVVAGRRTPTDRVEVYDPATGRVSPGPPLGRWWPTPVATTLGGRLYVAGSPDAQTRGEMVSLGPGESTWRPEPGVPRIVWEAADCEVEGRWCVYVRDRGVLLFDPVAGRWDTSYPLPPVAAKAAQVAYYRGELWAAGGRGNLRGSEVYRSALPGGTWQAGPDLPYPTAWGAGGVVGGRLIVAGGACWPPLWFSDLTLQWREPSPAADG